ncbi:hypothetical protein C4Q28_06030 [Pseudomonas sp. SWI6]|uniref:hypothetical protein n=1 Tax=Pseudomonas TaxID=286 RepID=UPI000CE5E911|nr:MULTISPECIES: hypothetical protein [Pseudomonas]HCF4204945.1 hypothetical protein [Pseudomonas aeruginosa]AVD81749.1 hypothetical protein C4Q28_06030 [Pseudomonas sp. SWI6]MDD2003636.1 hypothetical protein [Pseudomonas putida]UTH37275.1 hypothetical protein NLY39_03680 [Pseudomonas sp. KHPS1]CAB5601266.1 Uncharacterised protein [Pseudomonas putida]
MQIIIRGEMTIAQLRQTLYEKFKELEEDYGVQYFKGATLYTNPVNEFGEGVVLRNKCGQQVNKLQSNGPYKSAAEEFKI